LYLWRQDASAFESFSARIWAAVFVGGGDGGEALPCPVKVALDGDPKIDGCGSEADRQEVVDWHGGDDDDPGGAHGELLVHSCAS
jgi:hypothetical protein